MYHCKRVCRKAKVQVATLIDVVASADERGGKKNDDFLILFVRCKKKYIERTVHHPPRPPDASVSCAPRVNDVCS